MRLSAHQGLHGDEEYSPEKLVEEIRRGNTSAETAFYKRYQRGLLIMLEQRTGDRARAEDIAQDTLVTVLLKLRSEGIEQPEALNRFVHQTAKFIFLGWLRKSVNKTEFRETTDDIVEDQPTVEERLYRDQRRERVRKHIQAMSVPRDREILFRYYVNDQPKQIICDALDLSTVHFDRVINRARDRFKKLIGEQFANDD